jgi:hypothetical protein
VGAATGVAASDFADPASEDGTLVSSAGVDCAPASTPEQNEATIKVKTAAFDARHNDIRPA